MFDYSPLSLYIIFAHAFGNLTLADYLYILTLPKEKHSVKNYWMLYGFAQLGQIVSYPFRGHNLIHSGVFFLCLIYCLYHLQGCRPKIIARDLAIFFLYNIPLEIGATSIIGGDYSEYHWTSLKLALGVCIFVAYLCAVNMLIYVVVMRRREHISMKDTWSFLAFPVFVVFACISYLAGVKRYSVELLVLSTLIMIASYIGQRTLMWEFDDLIAKVHLEEDLTALYAKRQEEMDYYSLLAEHLRELRMLRHEFANQLQTAYTLMDQGDDTMVQRAYRETMSELESYRIERYCDNSILNAILTQKVQNARKRGIEVNASANVPEEIGIEKIDICSLYCNLIDNAVEEGERILAAAKGKAENEEPVTVDFHTEYRNGQLEVSVANPTTENAATLHPGKSRSAKENAKDHGYGLLLISRITEKYAGRMESVLSGGKMVVSVALGAADAV